MNIYICFKSKNVTHKNPTMKESQTTEFKKSLAERKEIIENYRFYNA